MYKKTCVPGIWYVYTVAYHNTVLLYSIHTDGGTAVPHTYFNMMPGGCVCHSLLCPSLAAFHLTRTRLYGRRLCANGRGQLCLRIAEERLLCQLCHVSLSTTFGM